MCSTGRLQAARPANPKEAAISFNTVRRELPSSISLALAGNSWWTQSWNSLVYHFTCTSSRGIEWWKPENQEKDVIRKQNDQIELKRFMDKWGTFLHPTSPNEVLGLNLDKSKIVCKNPPIDESNFEIL